MCTSWAPTACQSQLPDFCHVVRRLPPTEGAALGLGAGAPVAVRLWGLVGLPCTQPHPHAVARSLLEMWHKHLCHPGSQEHPTKCLTVPASTQALPGWELGPEPTAEGALASFKFQSRSPLGSPVPPSGGSGDRCFKDAGGGECLF